jgi:methylmalonyl-CoA/ethylmalonyl-CoA epimerase
MKLDRIHQIAIYAKDLEEAIAFYRDQLGANYLAKFDPPGLVFFEFSGTRLLLETTAPKGTVYFRVADLQSAYTELKEKGVKFISEPHLIFRDDNGLFGSAGEEEWMAFFSDPSDNILALVSRDAKKD